jgi:chagasin family peptidase inhibitor I42
MNVGDELEIKGSQGAGYEWYFTAPAVGAPIIPGQPYKTVSDQYIPSGSSLPGAPGTRILVIKALNEDITNLDAVYVPPG